MHDNKNRFAPTVDDAPSLEDEYDFCWSEVAGDFFDERLYDVGLVIADWTEFPHVAVEAVMHYGNLLLATENASLTVEEVANRHERLLRNFLDFGGHYCDYGADRTELTVDNLTKRFQLRFWVEPEKDIPQYNAPGFIIDIEPVTDDAMRHNGDSCPVSDALSEVLGALEDHFDIYDPKTGSVSQPAVYANAWPPLNEDGEFAGESCLPRIAQALRNDGWTVQEMPAGAERPTDWREENRRMW